MLLDIIKFVIKYKNSKKYIKKRLLVASSPLRMVEMYQTVSEITFMGEMV